MRYTQQYRFSVTPPGESFPKRSRIEEESSCQRPSRANASAKHRSTIRQILLNQRGNMWINAFSNHDSWPLNLHRRKCGMRSRGHSCRQINVKSKLGNPGWWLHPRVKTLQTWYVPVKVCCWPSPLPLHRWRPLAWFQWAKRGTIAEEFGGRPRQPPGKSYEIQMRSILDYLKSFVARQNDISKLMECRWSSETWWNMVKHGETWWNMRCLLPYEYFLKRIRLQRNGSSSRHPPRIPRIPAPFALHQWKNRRRGTGPRRPKSWDVNLDQISNWQSSVFIFQRIKNTTKKWCVGHKSSVLSMTHKVHYTTTWVYDRPSSQSCLSYAVHAEIHLLLGGLKADRWPKGKYRITTGFW